MKNLFYQTVLLLGISANLWASESNLVVMLEKMPASNGFRRVCINGNEVVGEYSTARSWHQPGNLILTRGTLSHFPQTRTVIDRRGPRVFKMKYPQGPEDWSQFKVLKQSAEGTGDTVYASPGQVMIHGQFVSAVCALESGGRLE